MFKTGFCNHVYMYFPPATESDLTWINFGKSKAPFRHHQSRGGTNQSSARLELGSVLNKTKAR